MSFVRDFLFGKAPEAPDYTPLANSSKEVAQMNLDYARERDAAAASDRQRLLDIGERTTSAQLGIAQKEAQRADDYYNYYKSTFRPVEQRIAQEAMDFSTEAERERMAGQAGADVAQAYKNVEGQQLRGMSRYGIGRPNAAAFAAQNNELMANKAGAIAGGKTGARFAARDMGYNRLVGASNIGRNYPAASLASSGMGIQGNSAANSGAIGTQGALNQTALVPSTYLAGAQQSYNAAGNLMNMGFQNRYNNWATQGQQTAAILNAAGMFMAADGTPGSVQDPKGMVRGPGTETSDSIPAMLSKGEYVIPADVVRKKGIEFFDKLLEKHHTPAAIQRAKEAQKFGIRRK